MDVLAAVPAAAAGAAAGRDSDVHNTTHYARKCVREHLCCAGQKLMTASRAEERQIYRASRITQYHYTKRWSDIIIGDISPSPSSSAMRMSLIYKTYAPTSAEQQLCISLSNYAANWHVGFSTSNGACRMNGQRYKRPPRWLFGGFRCNNSNFSDVAVVLIKTGNRV